MCLQAWLHVLHCGHTLLNKDCARVTHCENRVLYVSCVLRCHVRLDWEWCTGYRSGSKSPPVKRLPLLRQFALCFKCLCWVFSKCHNSSARWLFLPCRVFGVRLCVKEQVACQSYENQPDFNYSWLCSRLLKQNLSIQIHMHVKFLLFLLICPPLIAVCTCLLLFANRASLMSLPYGNASHWLFSPVIFFSEVATLSTEFLTVTPWNGRRATVQAASELLAERDLTSLKGCRSFVHHASCLWPRSKSLLAVNYSQTRWISAPKRRCFSCSSNVID